jgi:hypothetical protein
MNLSSRIFLHSRVINTCIILYKNGKKKNLSNNFWSSIFYTWISLDSAIFTRQIFGKWDSIKKFNDNLGKYLEKIPSLLGPFVGATEVTISNATKAILSPTTAICYDA